MMLISLDMLNIGMLDSYVYHSLFFIHQHFTIFMSLFIFNIWKEIVKNVVFCDLIHNAI